MHIAIIFHNIGGYHAARLRATYRICQLQGWQFTAIQETDNAHEHPWGNLSREITFPLITLLPVQEAPSAADRDPQSSQAASRLPTFLEQIRPDILVIPGWGYPISQAVLKWAKQHNLPAVLMSESKWNDAPRVWWKEQLKSLLYIRKFQAALVGGQSHENYLERLGFPKESIFKGYDIVDNDHFTTHSTLAKQNFHHTHSQYPSIPQRPYFISVSRFIERKNVPFLVDSFAAYRQAIHPENAWDLVICGSGVEESTIRSHIEKYQLQKSVHLPGFQPYQAIPSWFGLAGAFIHPAVSEQWGLVVNEAMASGLTVIVSNRCGCFEELVVEGVNGFGFDPTNQQQLTDIMLKISSGSIDLEKMGAAALHHIQNFSPEHFAQGLKQALEYVLTQKI